MKKVEKGCMNKSIYLKGISSLFAVFLSVNGVAGSLISLSDQELSETTGQALMSLGYIAPNESSNLMSKYSSGSNIGFYKLGIDADIELNANIANLQLGCGGMNNTIRTNSCDIDIKNIALSGLNDTTNSSGSPTFTSQQRAATDALINNPFIQFAIRNPEKASTREVVGVQLGAAAITGLLSLGTENGSTASLTDGLQSLSGFMQIAATTGTASTQKTIFGKTSNQILSGYAGLLTNGAAVQFNSQPTNSKTTGITIPSVSTAFEVPAFTINGVRQTSALVENIKTKISTIPIDTLSTDALYVSLGCGGNSTPILCPIATALVSGATFKMASGSSIQNLNMKITFQEALSMIHNIPLTGSGGYLSLQSMALIWPDSTVSAADISKNSLSSLSKGTDVAQPGWWMSFANPVQLGVLNVDNQVNIDAVLPQVASLVSTFLSKKENYPVLDLGQVLGAVVQTPISQKLNVDLNSYTLNNPATLSLINQKLANQTPVSNCYGSLKFC